LVVEIWSDCGDSKLKLECVKADPNSEALTCQCPQGLVWQNSKCSNGDNDATVELLSILSPLFAAVLFTLAFIIICCCCLNKSTDLIENKYDVETNAGEMYDDLSEDNDKSELNQIVKPKSGKLRNEKSEDGTELKDISKIKQSNGSGKNVVTSETSLSTSTTVKTTATSTPTTATTKVTIEKESTKAPKISIEPAKESTSKNELKQDQGYQASLKYLLERPQAGSEPSSRPLSAMTVDQVSISSIFYWHLFVPKSLAQFSLMTVWLW